jgi:hypothetical protein
VYQERQETSNAQKTIKHADDNHFLVNLYSLHHPHLLRNTLPASICKVTLLHQDRREFHNKISRDLVQKRTAKRANTTAKRQATIAAKKKKQTTKTPQPATQLPSRVAEQEDSQEDDTAESDDDRPFIESEDEDA